MLLKDRRIVVTGAGSERGIGLAACRLASEHGAETFALDRAFPARGLARWDRVDNGWRMACDITDARDCEAVASAIFAGGPVDGLIHCAGIAEPLGIADLTRERYERMLDVNLWGTMQLTKALLPAIRASKRGSIVCLSSLAGQRGGGFVGGIHYAAAKAAVMGFARTLARELASEGTRVNVVSPGLVDTDMTKPFMAAEMRDQLAKQAPMQRLGGADEIAGACIFLISDLSSYVTGATIDVNGGLHIH